MKVLVVYANTVETSIEQSLQHKEAFTAVWYGDVSRPPEQVRTPWAGWVPFFK